MARRSMKKETAKVKVRLLVPEAGNRVVWNKGTVREVTKSQAEQYVKLGRGELVEEKKVEEDTEESED